MNTMFAFLLMILFAASPAKSFLFTSCSNTCLEPQENVTGICDVITGECLYGCQDGFLGPNCTDECSPNCKKSEISSNLTCNATDGSCSLGCNDGFWGVKCNELCRYNIPDCKKCTANQESVTCLECVNNFKMENNGATCTCSFYCLPRDDLPGTNCDPYTGECVHGCKPGRYGRFCNLTCGNNCKNHVCHRYTGECTEGCVHASFCGTTCESICSNNCLHQYCDQSCTCAQGCIYNNWGSYCNNLCGSNCTKPLYQVPNICAMSDGSCLHGCRDELYWGNLCTRQCSSNCKSGKCEQNTGRCIACVNNRVYGDQCDQACNKNCVEQSCERNDGSCDIACNPGWYGEHCDMACSDNCAGSVQNKTDIALV